MIESFREKFIENELKQGLLYGGLIALAMIISFAISIYLWG